MEKEEKRLCWMVTDAYPHRVYCPKCFKTNVWNEEILFAMNDYPSYCMWCGVHLGMSTERRNEND